MSRHFYDRRTLEELHGNRLRNRDGEYLDTFEVRFETPPSDDVRSRAEASVRTCFGARIHWMGWGEPGRLTAMVQADYHDLADLAADIEGLGGSWRAFHAGRLYETVQPHAGKHRF